MRIEDGRGRGVSAGVDSAQRLSVTGEVRQDEVWAAQHGDSFTILTDFVTLAANASESGILFVRNDGICNLRVAQVIVAADANVKFRVYKNVTSGTLSSGAVSALVENMNFVSRKLFTGFTRRGGTNQTVADGDLLNTLHLLAFTTLNMPCLHTAVLPPGTSFAITAQPMSGSSLTVEVHAMVFYEDTSE